MEMNSGTSQKLAKKRTHKKHKTVKRRKQNDSSGDESVDMSEDVFPIAHYISNRDQMIEQVFAVMEKEKLNCMLPPILKGLTLSALKESCLKELKNMSDEEVRKILCGEPLETPPDNNSLTLQLDTDSGDSLPSVEEYCSVEEKKKTLLDILEQEMQEIAYNTVLKRDENTVCSADSDDDLPEIVAITPTNSCKSQNNVPLICIDSGDEESILPPYQSAHSNSTESSIVVSENRSIAEENHSNNHFESGIEVISIDETLEKDTDVSTKATTEEPEDLGSLPNFNKTGVSSQESFLIKVFSSNNSHSERVVKKFFKSSIDGKDADKITGVINDELEINKLDGRENNMSHSLQPLKEIEKEEEIEVFDLVENESTEEPGSPHSLSDHDITRSACNTSTTTTTTNNNQEVSHSLNNDDTFEVPPGNDEPLLNEEKEEGEISEEESDEDVEVVGNREQFPTVCLSSDSSSGKSDEELSESKTRGRKHHHLRHRRNKRRIDSPERSRRRIEKRGNRSYRRKTVTDNAPSPEKCQEVTTQEIDLNSISLPPGEMPTKPSLQNKDCAETTPLQQDTPKHPVVEDILKETNDCTNSPCNNLEDVVEGKCGLSEEPEEPNASEPVSTKTSWADRWAEKKDLKKVVITSKICRNVRKRILSARKKQIVLEPVCASVPDLPPVPPLVLHVEGSVQEYQMLQLLVSNGSDEENSQSKNVEVENLPDTLASESTTISNVPEGGCLSNQSEVAEDQQEKT